MTESLSGPGWRARIDQSNMVFFLSGDWTFELKFDGYVAGDIAVNGLNRVAVFLCGTSLSLGIARRSWISKEL